MILYLNVPFSQKDKAKSKGARWHPEKNRWYIPSGMDPTPFYDWLPSEKKREIDEMENQNDSETKGISLSRLMSQVQMAVKEKFKTSIWVHCEIASLSHHKSGHLYLEVIETDDNGREVCKNKAMIWKSNKEFIIEKFKQQTQQELKEGIKVLLLIEVDFHINFGLGLKINDIDPEFTLGGIEAKINKIRNALKQENIFNKNKKHERPVNFTNIAVISPPNAAGLGDFKAEADLLEYFNLCNFDYFEATFQGKQTNQSLTRTFIGLEVEFSKNIYDAVVLIRGGGAKTDLHFLNEYDIAKSICECPLPVIVGIGHEKDKVILDEVAYKSFDTPSKVAQAITQSIANYSKELIDAMQYIKSASKELVNKRIYFIDNAINTVFQSSKAQTKQRLYNLENDINSIRQSAIKEVYDEKENIKTSIKYVLEKSKEQTKTQQSKIQENIKDIFNDSKNLTNMTSEQLKSVIQEIEAYNPNKVLEKGYALVRKNGQIIKDVDELEDKDIIEIQIGPKKQTFKITKEN